VVAAGEAGKDCRRSGARIDLKTALSPHHAGEPRLPQQRRRMQCSPLKPVPTWLRDDMPPGQSPPTVWSPPTQSVSLAAVLERLDRAASHTRRHRFTILRRYAALRKSAAQRVRNHGDPTCSPWRRSQETFSSVGRTRGRIWCCTTPVVEALSRGPVLRKSDYDPEEEQR
jgi:hypothetical protein